MNNEWWIGKSSEGSVNEVLTIVRRLKKNTIFKYDIRYFDWDSGVTRPEHEVTALRVDEGKWRFSIITRAQHLRLAEALMYIACTGGHCTASSWDRRILPNFHSGGKMAFLSIGSRFPFPSITLPSCNLFLCLALTHKITPITSLFLFMKRFLTNLATDQTY
jgi:hypothetical protein